MAQGDFFFTITEEGDIINVEAIEGALNDEVVILEAFVHVTSEEESRPAASSSYGLALMAVAALEEPAAIAKAPPLSSTDSSSATPLASIRKASIDKETFDRFEGLLKNLKQLGIEALQRESEIQMAYKACLASVVETLSQHQSLMRGYEEEKASILSFHASFKEAGTACSAETKVVDEEREKFDLHLHQLKSNQL
ncbi:hypothetical protein AMTR_s00004p00255900 [Amborella trichopoda]|uniref:Uncharacterized protein n=1 Tax=Amborella trichopoda TaxID=13333 RepID=W1NEC9_AMBTC|nr:hypothetical protein AMTR_s00004p00255900 [Amborella trichopoda]